MKKPRPRRKPTKPPPAGARSPQLQRDLQYKVVELSTVDEASLERTLNEWIARGWNLDGVQFAMRESSKRPAMAFVFFTRDGLPAARPVDEARDRLARMAGVPPAGVPPAALPAAAEWSAPDAASLGAEENGAVRWVELAEAAPDPDAGPDAASGGQEGA